MADLTALDMALEDSILLNEYVVGIGQYLRMPACDGKIDCTRISEKVRNAQSLLNNIRDNVFTINREQKGSDEAIQKQQMLYRKEQERLAREARERAEQEALKPAPFSLD